MWTITRLSWLSDALFPEQQLAWAPTLRQLRSIDFERNVSPWLCKYDRVVITRPNGTIHSILQ